MKRLCSYFFLLLCFISSVVALQVYPQSIVVVNETHDFSFYVSEKFIGNSTCPGWFSIDTLVTYSYDDAFSYSSCTLYFSAIAGLETVAVLVNFHSSVLQNDTSEIFFSPPFVSQNQTGIEVVIEKKQKTSPLGAFVGSIDPPDFRFSTVLSIVFVLFFVTVVFLLIPKG